MYLPIYYLNLFKAVCVFLQDDGSNNMNRFSVLQRILLKQKRIKKAVQGQTCKIQPWYFSLWVKQILEWHSNKGEVNDSSHGLGKERGFRLGPNSCMWECKIQTCECSFEIRFPCLALWNVSCPFKERECKEEQRCCIVNICMNSYSNSLISVLCKNFGLVWSKYNFLTLKRSE